MLLFPEQLRLSIFIFKEIYYTPLLKIVVKNLFKFRID